MNNQSGQFDRKKLEEIINNMKGNGEHFEMLMKESSKLLFIRYRSLVEAGFTEAQAFELVRSRGLE